MKLCAGLGVLYLTKLNTYLVDHPKLLLTLIWVFFFIAVIPGVIITVYYPTMGYFKFLAVIIVPAAIALYRVWNRRRWKAPSVISIRKSAKLGYDQSRPLASQRALPV